jgi:hypothetical protein
MGSLVSDIETKPETVRRNSNVVSRVVVGEAIVVPIRRGVADMDYIYTFNESGTLLWGMVEGDRKVAEMIERLRTEYSLSEEQAVADVEAFITELIEMGLLERAMGS